MNIIFKILGMIANSRNKTLVISFGLGMTTMSCEVGDEVNVYVDGIYNQNEFMINQDEVQEVVILNVLYFDFTINQEFQGDTEAISQGIYNNKKHYLINILGTDFVLVYANAQNGNVEQWVITDSFNFISGVYGEVYSRLIQQNNVSENWLGAIPTDVDPAYSLRVFNSTSNITTGGFTFPATVSKDVQIEMQRRDGTILKSNKINLIVN